MSILAPGLSVRRLACIVGIMTIPGLRSAFAKSEITGSRLIDLIAELRREVQTQKREKERYRTRLGEYEPEVLDEEEKPADDPRRPRARISKNRILGGRNRTRGALYRERPLRNKTLGSDWSEPRSAQWQLGGPRSPRFTRPRGHRCCSSHSHEPTCIAHPMPRTLTHAIA